MQLQGTASLRPPCCSCTAPTRRGASLKRPFLSSSLEQQRPELATPASAANGSTNGPESSASSASTREAQVPSPDGLASNFCIIESQGTVKAFDKYDLQEIKHSIETRRNRIFLLMEEVRRLRIEQRLKGGEVSQAQELAEEKFVSALPFLPPLDETSLNQYYYAYMGLFAAIIVFGGLVAPILEVKLGLGGTSYEEFVRSVHLPTQLAQVDPIVASFCGGAVGVLSSLLLVEVNNIKKQQKNRCHYCKGTGYLMCGNCVGSGLDQKTGNGCSCCSKTGKVMCTGCLCTGKSLATEHDPRIDPFD